MRLQEHEAHIPDQTRKINRHINISTHFSNFVEEEVGSLLGYIQKFGLGECIGISTLGRLGGAGGVGGAPGDRRRCHGRW